MTTGKIVRCGILPISLAISSCPLLAQGAPPDLPHVALPNTPSLIYSTRPDDPWNQIFYFLFSRRLQVRLSEEFPEGAPFLDLGVGTPVSKNLFERNETGDRAIDPLYPTFFVGFGGMLVLRDPAYPQFTKSLRAALDDNSPRSPVGRAMMQSDLWGAYDRLSIAFLPDDERALGDRRKAVVDLIGRLIRKVALTRDEIKALPENYSAAVSQDSFPNVFSKTSGWLEVKWFLPRQHDDQAEYRRVTRVFLKPTHPQHDLKKFLNSLPSDDPENSRGMDGVALITQLILLDSHGNPQPTNVTLESQVRLFDRTPKGKLLTSLKVCEVSRKMFMENPGSGGLVPEDDATPVYLSNGGSYGFAEGHLTERQIREPIQVKMRTRCARCHDEDLGLVRTFAIARPPHAPPVKQLDSAGRDAVDFDIAKKRKQQVLQALLAYFR